MRIQAPGNDPLRSQHKQQLSMLADQELLDTGTKRLLELGIRQQLHRPLHWTQNTMICFCILSSITCITGILH